mmetsp:Transcript_12485/g.23429  ORF Transcript_12485/g.23429 Transcript_12485/m.23429 type:complete len:445 (+) Transcript_12485:357-1691(+)
MVKSSSLVVFALQFYLWTKTNVTWAWIPNESPRWRTSKIFRHCQLFQQRFLDYGSPLLIIEEGTRSTILFSTASQNELAEEEQTCELSNINYAILISSFTDSMTSTSTLQFFKYSLASLLTMDEVQVIQKEIEQSTMYSPCQGANIELLDMLQGGDELLVRCKDNMSHEDKTKSMLRFLTERDRTLELRVLYIPTAMYALNPNSSNTPGKQRQRARADGKKRRNQLVQCIQDLFQNDEDHLKLNILAVTLDFDDGSIKQPTGSQIASTFPKTGEEALTSWEPHLIYIEGGNTFWLHHCMVKGEKDWMELVKNACCSHSINNDNTTQQSQRRPALYIGKSAGAIVAGKYVETATWKGWDDPSVIPGKETYDKWKGVLGMDMIGGASIFPHMSEEWVETVQEKTVSGMLSSNSKVFCLREPDVCCIETLNQDVLLSGSFLVVEEIS